MLGGGGGCKGCQPTQQRWMMNGMVVYNKIKAYQMFSLTARLLKKIAEAFKLHCKPVYAMMEKGFGIIPEELTPEIVNNLY